MEINRRFSLKNSDCIRMLMLLWLKFITVRKDFLSYFQFNELMRLRSQTAWKTRNFPLIVGM